MGRLGQRFGISGVCVVADRGMISAVTITALEARGLEYILGVRERTAKEVRTIVLGDAGTFVPLSGIANPFDGLIDEIRISTLKCSDPGSRRRTAT